MPTATASLYHNLVEALGERGVSIDATARERASRDGSHLSPVIQEQLPLGLADVVAYPTSIEQVQQAVALAVKYDVPITPRGKGTANYGQTIPMQNGLVLDLSRLRAVGEQTDTTITAEAGVTMAQLEQRANKAGKQVLLYPSTIQSSLGGFLSGGSGGTGSIAHGMLHTGFVTELDVIHALPDAPLVHLTEPETEQYLHNYGTTGIIVRATVRLEPLQPWHAVYAAFPDHDAALSTVRALVELPVTPRLLSVDPALLAAALPNDPEALPAGSASVRGIFDVSVMDEVRDIVTRAGGHITADRDDLRETLRMSTISYNHAIEWLQKSHPGKYFHIEVIGWNLISRRAEVEAIYPEGALHLEGQQGRPIGMLAGRYTSAQDVWDGFAKLEALDIGFHNPHQWYVDYVPERSLALAATTDPQGLLNPGKLVAQAPVATGSQQ